MNIKESQGHERDQMAEVHRWGSWVYTGIDSNASYGQEVFKVATGPDYLSVLGQGSL